MITKYKNVLMEKIQESGSLTDKSLIKILVKDGYHISDDHFNKTLLDLEIMGLVTVSWLTKDTRRIEIVTSKEEEDDVETQNEKTAESDYENSFPEPNNNS